MAPASTLEISVGNLRTGAVVGVLGWENRASFSNTRRQMVGDVVTCRGVNGAEIEVGEIVGVLDMVVGAWCEGLVDAGEQRFDSRLERGWGGGILGI